MKRLLYLFCLLIFLSASYETVFAQDWILSEFIENHSHGVHYKGNPKIVDSPYGKAVSFNGQGDGIFLDQMPLSGLRQFTIEAIFKPESGGNFEQRFFHCGEIGGDRVLLELRATQTEWYFDAFIKCGNSKEALIDPELKHPLDQWYHVAFVVDNGKLSTYINGKKELDMTVESAPIKTGKTSFGVRLNKQSWFKGVIKQFRITPKALDTREFITLAEPAKPRILISTDIGGTDPDDFQSMAHLLMYSDRFDIEGLVSSPSFGDGHKEAIFHIIDLYEKDLPKLKKGMKSYITPNRLRELCKQGRHGGAPLKGYTSATEGSDWIVECARKKSNSPLWVLVWGGLEDVAQALHDAPDIADKIKVYWIGGPNKKWSVNSYVYIAENFPNLWMIENNASYRGFITDNKNPDEYNTGYYDKYIREAGHLGEDFINYYKGVVKMGDTPSLLYMMNGDPENPLEESWGGSFEKSGFSPRTIFDRNTTINDTVAVYSVIEFHLNGPKVDIPIDTACITLRVDKQDWDGYYLGEGKYIVKYSPKATATLTYEITSDLPGFKEQKGVFVVNNTWPGTIKPTDYTLGDNWYTDKQALDLYENQWQGSKTVSKWRNEVLKDWGTRWELLK